MNNVSCRHDMTEILLKWRKTPFNQWCFRCRFIEKQGLGHTFYECDYHLWKLGKRQLPRGIQFGGGSDWMGLYRGFCQYSVSNTDLLITGLKELYRFTFCPVEVCLLAIEHVCFLSSPRFYI